MLLNGRRLVNSPGYQTELIGGDFVPTVTVNSSIPVSGIERLEVLRDGASAIYGADAVYVNNVLQTDYEGLRFYCTSLDMIILLLKTQKLPAKWGSNGGDTNVAVFFEYYDRDNINAQEDPGGVPRS